MAAYRRMLCDSVLIHPSLVINETLKVVHPYYLKSSWPTDLNTRQKLDEMITEQAITEFTLRHDLQLCPIRQT